MRHLLDVNVLLKHALRPRVFRPGLKWTSTRLSLRFRA